jgi:hypothetical protein
MIDNIRCPKLETLSPAVGSAFSDMGFAVRDFRVFDYAGFVVFEDDETDGFVGGTFSDDFGGDGEGVEERVAYEGGVCDAD